MTEDDTVSKLKYNFILRKGTEVMMLANQNGKTYAWKYVGKALWFVKENQSVSERFNFEKVCASPDPDIMALTAAEIPEAVLAQINFNEEQTE